MLAPSLTPKPQPQAAPPSLTPKREPYPKPEQVLLSLARAGHVAEALRLLDAASGRGVLLAPSLHEERELWLHCFEHGVQDDAPPQSIRVAAGRSLAAAWQQPSSNLAAAWQQPACLGRAAPTHHVAALLTLTCRCDVTAQAATWPMYEHLFERFAIHRRPPSARGNPG